MRILWGLRLLLILPASTVLAQASGSAEVVTVDTVVVTATKTNMDPNLVPFNQYTVTRKDDEKRPDGYFSNVGEMVRNLPGVHVGQFCPWGLAWIQLRGTGNGVNRTVNMVDGLPVYVYQNSTINTHDIGQVDVLLGPSSALYGANASGGVVNMITRSGHEGMGATIEMAYGSRGTYKPHFHLGDAVAAGTGKFKYYLSYSGEISNGFMMQPVGELWRSYKTGGASLATVRESGSIQDNDYRFHFLASSLDWEGDEGAKLSLSVNYADRWLNGPQPGTIAIDHGQQWVTSLRASTYLTDWLEAKLAIGYQNFEGYSIGNNGLNLAVNGNVIGVNSNPRKKYIGVGTGNREQIPVDVQFNVNPWDNNTVTVGSFYNKGKVSPGAGQGWTRNLQTGLLEKDQYWDEEQISFYIQDALLLMDNRLSLIAGLRYDHWKYDGIYNSQNTPQDLPEVSFNDLNFRLGAKYLIGENWSVRGAYGTAYYMNPQNLFSNNRPATADATWRLPHSDLNPEKTRMTELGLDFSKPEWGTDLRLTGYYGEIKDVQGASATLTDVSGAVTGDPGRKYNYIRNYGQVEIHGLEIGLKQDIVPDLLHFQGSATFNYSRITKDKNKLYKGNHLSHAPDFSCSAGLYFSKSDLFNASLVYSHTDDRYYNNANTEAVHYHMGNVDLLDAKIWRDWFLSDKLTMRAQLSSGNLTDQDYEALYLYLGPGRYVEGLISFTYSF